MTKIMLNVTGVFTAYTLYKMEQTFFFQLYNGRLLRSHRNGERTTPLSGRPTPAVVSTRG